MILMFLGLPDPHPDPLVTSTHRIRIRLQILQAKIVRKTLNFYCFVASYDLLPVFRIRMFLGLPDPDPLDRGTDPRIRISIRIHAKKSRIHNTVPRLNKKWIES
jgi:hypothetical protein